MYICTSLKENFIKKYPYPKRWICLVSIPFVVNLPRAPLASFKFNGHNNLNLPAFKEFIESYNALTES